MQQRAEKVIQESSKRDTMNQEAVAASREEARLARAQRQAEQQERRRLEMERAAAEQRAEEEAQRADQRAARVVGFRALAAAAGVEAAQRKAANEAETEARRAAQERELEREAPAVAAAEDWERDAVPEIDASVAPSLRFPSEQPKASTRPRPVTMGGTAGAAASSQVRVEVVEDEGSPTEVGPSLHTGGEEGRGGKLSRSLFAPPMPRAAPFAQEEVRVEGDAPTAPSSGTGLMDAEAVPTRPVRLRMDLERARSLETRAHSLHRAAVEQDSALQEALGLVGGQKRRLSARVDQLLLMDRELNDLLAGPPQRQPRPEERDALHARRHERLALRERLKVMDQREARLRQDATRARATMQQAAGEVEKRREEVRCSRGNRGGSCVSPPLTSRLSALLAPTRRVACPRASAQTRHGGAERGRRRWQRVARWRPPTLPPTGWRRACLSWWVCHYRRWSPRPAHGAWTRGWWRRPLALSWPAPPSTTPCACSSRCGGTRWSCGAHASASGCWRRRSRCRRGGRRTYGRPLTTP